MTSEFSFDALLSGTMLPYFAYNFVETPGEQ